MKKPIIAVDIDEVLFPFVREFAVHHNEKYATSLLPEQFTTYRFEDVIAGIDQSEAIKRVYDFTAEDHASIEPLKDAREGITRLGAKYDIVLVTARHPKFKASTEGWLDRYFPGMFKDLVMIGFEHDATVAPRTKAQVCVELEAIALVDDSPKYLSQAVEAGVKGILFGDYPWNQVEFTGPYITRVSGWIQLAEHFNA